MLLSAKCFMSTKIPHHFIKEKCTKFTVTFAKKPQISELPSKNKKPIFKFNISNKIIAQSAIAILGLGFVDAGYSGDWSRIGVISKDLEDVLKIAAFLVVPLCLFVIFSLQRNSEK